MRIIEELNVKEDLKLIVLDGDIPLNAKRNIKIDGKIYSYELPFDMERNLIVKTTDTLIDKNIVFEI